MNVASDKPRRVIKRYSNRKLYDTRDSRYVTLQQIGEFVRAGEEVQIIDNATKEDKTEVTLALILSEDLKSEPRSVPLGTLRNLIQQGGERILTQLREGPMGRLIPGHGEGAADTQAADGSATESGEPAVAASTDTEHLHPEKGKTRLVEIVEHSRQTLEEWQHAVDERIRAVMPQMALKDLQAQVKKLEERVEALEAKLRS